MMKILKNLVRFLLKTKIFYPLQKINFKRITYKTYLYDANKYLLHSNSFYQFNTKEKFLGHIIAEYHALEKGLCMPERRAGFGKLLVNNLMLHCERFIKQYGIENENVIHAIRVIHEYAKIHEENPEIFEPKFWSELQNFTRKYNFEFSDQIEISREEFFKYKNASFDLFAKSRHSVRNYTGTIEISDVEKAITLAQTAPSSCNRQPSRVYIIQDGNLKSKVLSLQNGNRGFGHLADKILIVTVNLNYFLNINERNEAYINGGMFALNLLYSLHFYGIGACPLNWCAEIHNDKMLRSLCNIPDNEIVILLITLGHVPEKFKLPISPRLKTSTIVNYR